jgi:hypothetical protein
MLSFRTTLVVRNLLFLRASTTRNLLSQMHYHSRMNFLRFLMVLAIAIWLGALIFFPVVPQISFTALPSPHLAGMVVRNSLINLHWMGMGAGIVFVACSLAESRFAHGHFSSLRSSHLLVVIMFAFTAISQFEIIPQMDLLRMRAGEISQLSASDPVRRQFDSLHVWSTRIESIVLVLGLIVLYLTTRRLAASRA